MNLATRHPEYEATQAARVMGRDLFEGDAAVRAKGETYLYKEKNESTEDYDLRLKRAVLDPYVEKIVGARQSVLFRKEPERKLPKKLDGWAEDVDRKGTPASVFFAEAAREAQIDGIHWVLVDMPKRPEPAPASAAAEQAAGLRPFFEHVPADAVIDWEVGPDLALLWAVIQETVSDPRPEGGWGAAPSTRTRWKVWSRTAWAVFEAAASDDKGGKGDKEPTYTEVDGDINPTGVVPLVPFFGIRYGDFAGWPVARAVFPHVLAIYNKTSDMDWFERLSAHPIPWMISAEKPELLNTAKGLWFKAMQGVQAQVGYLETTGAAFSSLRESIRELQAKVYAIALAQAQKDSAQVQAAEGQREDRKIFTSSLRMTSVGYEAAELRCWQLMGLWAQEASEPEVKYDRDFDDKSVETAMITTLADLVDRDIITKRTLLQSLVNGEVLELPDGVDAELDAVETAASERTAETASNTLKLFKAAGGATGVPAQGAAGVPAPVAAAG
jgi:hypothetical protein